MANPQCNRCGGTGLSRLTTAIRDGQGVCECVYRRIFGDCFGAYKRVAPCSSQARRDGITVSRPSEEYAADFERVARRALLSRPELLRLFETYIETSAICTSR